MNKKTKWITGGAIATVIVVGAGVGIAVADPFDGDEQLSGSTLEQASEAALAEVGEGTVTDAEASDDLDHAYEVEVRREDGSDVDVALDESFEVVWVDGDARNDSPSNTNAPSTDAPATTEAPTSSESDDLPLTEAERTAASDAALAAVGSGSVTDIDRSDDADHAFEVEVTREDGSDVEVELDAQYQVVRVDDDSQRVTG
ncbi:MAG TPA: PepSY domain-containing protein [Glaciihabitans sp.]|jgi:uncharacterized membrane protein YkoI|nr:PepSY domain-containing protein [Glaciihabitans sp.]